MYYNNQNNYSNYNGNYNNGYHRRPMIELENEMLRQMRDDAINSELFAIQIKNNGITQTFKWIPSRWLRFTNSSIKTTCRLYPSLTSFQVNVVGMDIVKDHNKKYTLTNPGFDIEVKIIFA